MTEPSQYFKGRTVQEQMNEVIGYVDTRAAEVATNAIAADVAQVHQDMLDADADAQAAAASAAAAAGTLANAVKKTGEASQSIAGDISVSGALTGGSISAGVGGLGVGGHSALQDVTVSGNITVPTPTANGYAANKKYVDDADALKLNITDVNSYAVGLTGPQTVRGVKKHLDDVEMEFANTVSNGLIMKSTYADVTAGTYQIGQPKISTYDKNGVRLSRIHTVVLGNGSTQVVIDVRNSDGTVKTVVIAAGDII